MAEVQLYGQKAVILRLMQDGERRTIKEIAAITGFQEVNIPGRLRDLAKEEFGGHNLQKQRLGRSCEYWIALEETGV